MAVLRRLLPQVCTNRHNAFLGHMLVFLLPKLGLSYIVRRDIQGCVEARIRFLQYPAPQLDDLLALARKLGGPDGLRRRAAQVVADIEGKVSAKRTSPPGTTVAIDADVLSELRALHPNGSPELAFHWNAPVPRAVDFKSFIRRAIHSLDHNSAPGPSGWTPSLVSSAINLEAFAKYLNNQLDAMRCGEADGKPFFCASRLTCIAKSNGGIRPIAVSEIFYRVLMRSVLHHYGDVCAGLRRTQFGLNTPGGVEPIMNAVERAVDGSFPCAQITHMDFSNAFNSISRNAIAKAINERYKSLYHLTRWAYCDSTPLLIASQRDGSVCYAEMESREGIRQGDPLGPLLFCAGFREYLDTLEETLGRGHTILSYLDDVIIISERTADVAGAAVQVSETNSFGLRLNTEKSQSLSREQVITSGMYVLGTFLHGCPHAPHLPPKKIRTNNQPYTSSRLRRLKRSRHM